jgi:transposase
MEKEPPESNVLTPPEPTIFVGVDWASQDHQVCLVKGNETPVQRSFAHSADGLNEMVVWLVSQHPDASQIGVAIETPQGPVVEALMDKGIGVFSLNPKQLDRFRDRLSPAGAKDDRRDALVLALSLRTDRHCFRHLVAIDPVVVELRAWSRIADELKEDRIRLTNRMRQSLWRYYPQALELHDDIGADWVLDILEMAPTPAAAGALKLPRLTKILTTARIRRTTGPEVLAILRKKALTVAPGTTEAASAHVLSCLARVRLVNQQLKQAHKQLDALIDRLCPTSVANPEGDTLGSDNLGQRVEQPDAAILSSLPGVGRIVLATLLSEAHHALQSRDYHALRCLCGVAPVTKRSGKSMRVGMRNACAGRARTAVYHWSRVAIQHDQRARSQYTSLRAKGHTHGRALRGVGDRLLATACAMLKSNTTFNPDLRKPMQMTQNLTC